MSRPPPLRATVPAPHAPADLEALVGASDELARHYALEPASRHLVEEMLADVLVRKAPVAACREHLLTREEACKLVLAHMQTLLVRTNGRDGVYRAPSPALEARVESALFGAEPSNE